MTENTFMASASGTDDPPPPLKGLRRLMIWIIPANLGIFMLWGATMTWSASAEGSKARA